MPEILAGDGMLFFVSEKKLQEDWQFDALASYPKKYPLSAKWLSPLIEELAAAAPRVGCAEPDPLSSTDDIELGSADFRIRADNCDVAVIGVVEEVERGWSPGRLTPRKLVRFRVDSVLGDRQQVLTEATSMMFTYQGDVLRVGDRTICAQQGSWRPLAPGDRLLVYGFWEARDVRFLRFFDIVPIEDGQLDLSAEPVIVPGLEQGISEVGLKAWFTTKNSRLQR
ncbi:MAG: hypothetical protein ABI639_12520 [Thermoanaerobaculia bacterium]